MTNRANELRKRCEMVIELMQLDEEIREVEDDHLETWLMVGPPDGATIGECFDEDDFIVEEWLDLGHRLLKRREEEDED